MRILSINDMIRILTAHNLPSSVLKCRRLTEGLAGLPVKVLAAGRHERRAQGRRLRASAKVARRSAVAYRTGVVIGRCRDAAKAYQDRPIATARDGGDRRDRSGAPCRHGGPASRMHAGERAESRAVDIATAGRSGASSGRRVLAGGAKRQCATRRARSVGRPGGLTRSGPLPGVPRMITPTPRLGQEVWNRAAVCREHFGCGPSASPRAPTSACDTVGSKYMPAIWAHLGRRLSWSPGPQATSRRPSSANGQIAWSRLTPLGMVQVEALPGALPNHAVLSAVVVPWSVTIPASNYSP